jgi:hypothetical protein
MLKIEVQFRCNFFSLLWPIDNKLYVWVAYIKTLLLIAIKISVNVAKKEIQSHKY